MKFTFTILLVIISLISPAQVIIQGRILNYDGKSNVYYRHTWGGIHTINEKSVEPRPNGVFRIKFENDGYGTVNVGYRFLSYRFFVDRDSRIFLEIDQDKIKFPNRFSGPSDDGTDRGYIRDSVKQAATLSIRGDYLEVNDFYNRTLRISYGSLISVSGNQHSRLIAGLETPDMVLLTLDSLVQREINEINRLNIQLELENTSSESVNQEIKDFLVNETRAYYGIVFLNAMLLKKYEQLRMINQDSMASLTVYNSKWQHLIDAFNNDMHQNLNPAPNSSDYNELVRMLSYMMKSYKEYNHPHIKSVEDDIYEKLLSPDSLLFNDPGTVIAYRLNWLHIFLNSEMFYSPALLDAVYQLQFQYPDLAHWGLLKPLIEKLKASILSAGMDYDKAIIIKTHYTSFMDLIGQFKGKNLFIDIWATWCGPCVKDFQYKDVIMPFVDDQQLEWLYISIDKALWKDRWKQSIKYNELHGHHVRANDVLITDMWKVLGGYEGAIPRYVLVDKKGNIFISTAARPSESDILVQQISDLIAQSEE